MKLKEKKDRHPKDPNTIKHTNLISSLLCVLSNVCCKGVFTPIVCLLWSESVNELADLVHFQLVWFDFTHAKCQANQNLSTKSHVKAVACSSVTDHMGFVGGEK